MRIISLSATATEWIFKIGAASDLVSFTGYPGCTHIPEVTISGVGTADLCSGAVDPHPPGFVEDLLEKSPDVIFVDDHAESVSDLEDLVKRSGAALYRVKSRTFKQILDAGLTVGKGIGRFQDAAQFIAASERKLSGILNHLGIHKGIPDSERRKVLFLRSLEPPVVAGCWIPDLIEMAGALPVIVPPGAPSREVSWQDVSAAGPDLIVAACPEETRRQFDQIKTSETPSSLSERFVILEESLPYYTPGPKLYEAMKAILFSLHPDKLRGMESL